MFEYSELKINRNFGVEFEIGSELSISEIQDILTEKALHPIVSSKSWGQSTNNNYWHAKYDGSCGVLGHGKDHGWEIATFKASTIRDLEEICKVISIVEKTVQVNNNCGLHVHVDVGDFTIDQLGVLVAYWVKIEKCLFEAVPARRRRNYYCKMLSRKRFGVSKKYTPTEFWEYIRPKNLAIHENSDRRYALNLVNITSYIKENSSNIFLYGLGYEVAPASLNQKSTIEFRFPEGTLSPIDTFNWVSLFVTFVEHVKTLQMPEDMKKISNINEMFSVLGLHGTQSSFKFLDIKLTELKTWLYNRIVEYGTDNIKLKLLKQVYSCGNK